MAPQAARAPLLCTLLLTPTLPVIACLQLEEEEEEQEGQEEEEDNSLAARLPLLARSPSEETLPTGCPPTS